MLFRSTEIADIVFEQRREKNPCSLCAKMRRGALGEMTTEKGCNKLALGHHLDDAVETLFLNLFYEGRLGCFAPVTWLSRVGLTVIRPLIYVEERQIRSLVQREGYPVYHNPCCANGNTKRQEIKELLAGLEEYTAEPPRGDEFGARVFKISDDPQGARLTHMKITSGCLKVKDVLHGSGWAEKADQIRIYSGAKYQTVDQIGRAHV